MASEIPGYVKELKSLNIEIKRLSTRLKKLRSRKKNIENKISNYLEHTNKPGIKFQGNTIVLKKTEKCDRKKKKKEKERDGSNVLSKYGIKNPEKVLQQVMEAMRGEKIESNTLKFK